VIRCLLASDGLLTLGENEIAALLTRAFEAEESPCRRLLAAVEAHRCPHQDNVTVLWAEAADRPPASVWRRLGGRAPLLALLVAALLTLGGAWWLAQDMETVASTAAPP
jgi:ferric-dicitrate binding protein FerR (iron transport regulator)